MRIIDAHVHVFADERANTPYPTAGRAEHLLHLMDQAGVELALLVPAVGPQSPTNREDCARLAAAHPDRLATLADITLHRPDAADLVARARQDIGAVGISYYPDRPDLDWLLAPACEPVWAACATAGLPCNLHLGPAGYGVVLALAARHPQVTFVLSHFGLPGRLFGPEHDTYGGLLAGPTPANLVVKASAFYSVAERPWDWGCPRALGFLRALLRGLGPQRVLWGTDWPPAAGFVTYRQAVEAVRSCLPELTAAELAAVLGGNAARIFRV